MLFLTPPAPTATAQVETLTLTPVADVWVYPHASDPGGDEAMRVWGTGGRSVATDPADASEFSYGYLRFALPASLKGARIVGATLELTNVVNDDLDPDETKATPIEVRPLIGAWEEGTFTHANVAAAYPDAKRVYGRGVPTLTKGQPPKFAIDLFAPGKDGKPSLFPAAIRGVASGGQIGLALTSAVDAAEVGMKRIYKLATKESPDESRRPRLVLKLGETG